MKIGIREPSIKKSIKARTTGRVKRAIKSSINPLYGKKGMGWINNPKKALYNKVYNKTTVGVTDILGDKTKNTSKTGGALNGIGSIFGLIGSLIQIAVALIQLIFYGALLIGIIWVVIQIIKL